MGWLERLSAANPGIYFRAQRKLSNAIVINK
jgi:hypothetical protein